MAFEVKEIIDGNTIIVVPNWKWKDMNGNKVQILGYTVSKETMNFTVSKLQTLISGRSVELKNPKGINDEKKISCSVYLNGIDVSQYFPELK